MLYLMWDGSDAIASLLHAIGVNDTRRCSIGQGGRTRKSYRD